MGGGIKFKDQSFKIVMISLIIIIIVVISLILAERSMGDFDVPEEIKRWFSFKRIKGSIVFFKNKIKHYH